MDIPHFKAHFNCYKEIYLEQKWYYKSNALVSIKTG